MTKHEFSSFSKFAQQDFASTLAIKYRRAVQNMTKRFGKVPFRPTSTRIPNFSSRGSTFNRYVNAITGQESAGNWGAINKTSGALGRYQFMPSTLSNLGYTGTRRQFLNNPQVQNKFMRIFTNRNAKQLGFGSDSNKWTRQQVKFIAAAHYGGVGGARRLMRGDYKYGNKNFGGKTPYAYVGDIDRRMKWR